ncbi:MAG: hypothetical protein WB973_09630 [Thermoanaerobaculia bacterium]
MLSFEYVNSGFVAWTEDWAAVAFHPHRYFQYDSVAELTALEFLIGTQLLTCATCLVTSLAFFVLFHWHALTAHLRDTSAENAVSASKLLASIAVITSVSFVALLLTTWASFAVARLLGSSTDITKHVDAYFHLVALDPLAILGITLFLLADGQFGVMTAGLVIFAIARVWLFAAGVYAAVSLHPISRVRRVLLLLIGYAPSFIVLNVLLVVAASFIALIAVTGWD